jgi:hypothetical protein
MGPPRSKDGDDRLKRKGRGFDAVKREASILALWATYLIGRIPRRASGSNQ